MKSFFIAALCFFCVPLFAFAEEIVSFSSNIDLHTDGTFTVTENIEYDFGSENRHGIFRNIKKAHAQEASTVWKDRYIEIELQNVLMDAQRVPYEITDGRSKLEVVIGDPDSTISGAHTYTIVYKVIGGYSYFDDGSAEVYWNATGDHWEVPIASATASISGVPLENDSACYVGAEGDETPCTTVESGEQTVVFAARTLEAGSGLTVAQQIDGNAVEKVVLERFKLLLFSFLILPFLIGGVAVFGYRYQTAHATGRTIIAQYEPYKDYKPMYSGMLLDGRLDPNDITAGIVYLAEQGFITIKKTDKKVLFVFEVDDYSVELKRPIDEVENTYLKDVLELLFPSDAQKGSIVTLGELKNNLAQQKKNYKKLQKLREDLKKDMQQSGFFQVNLPLVLKLLGVGGIAFALTIAVGIFIPELVVLLVVVCVLFIAIMITVYERRTRTGYEALDHLKGFKLFLSMTEKERYAFHNAPQKSPEQFMKYLPYAIAFGVEKQWAEVFKDITIPNPGWYEGDGAGTFTAVHLTSSLGAFSTSFAASATASSSSSGGSGGGGFSGGGGGGGGGGSW